MAHLPTAIKCNEIVVATMGRKCRGSGSGKSKIQGREASFGQVFILRNKKCLIDMDEHEHTLIETVA